MQVRRRARRVGLGVTLLVLLGIVFAAGGTVPLHAQGGDSSGPPPELSILSAEDAAGGMLSAAKGELQKLDSYLARLTSGAGSSQLQSVENTVVVEIVIAEGSAEAIATTVAAAGGEVTVTSDTASLVQARLPVAALATVAADANVNLVRQPTLLYTDTDSSLDAGLVTTEALRVSGAKLWQSAGFTGKGVKIGVIDVDFTGADVLISSGDLPSSTYYKDFGDPSIYVTPSGSGTAAAEVIHDMAPDAEIYLARVKTVPELEEAAATLLVNGVTILSSSIYAIANGPGDGTGYIPSVIAASRSLGLLWINTAGDNRLATWSGVNLDYDRDSWVNFSGASEINWINQPLAAGVPIYFAARWSDWTYVNQDLDLCVYRWPVGSIFATQEACSNNPQTNLPGQKPVEWLSGTTYGGPAYYGVAIQNYAANRLVDLQVFSSHDLGLATAQRSLVDLADAPAAMTVAAIDVASPYPRTARSSEGPTNGPGGTAKPGYLKPDIVGYSGVSTVTTYPYTYWGSSAAAPHVAGAAALVAQAYDTTDPDEIQTFLEGRAIDRGSTGFDSQYGAGQLSLGRPPVEYTPFDFDGDQQADILWSNRAAGRAAVQLMMSGAIVDPLKPSPGVDNVAAGVGDFTGDGKADVIWYNPNSRRLAIHDSGLDEVTLVRYLNPGWRVVGVGDLDGDGIDDIVLRNLVFGYSELWLMQYGLPAAVYNPRSYYGPSWRLAGIGDMSGNGTADLLWQNTISNRYRVDLMIGPYVTDSYRIDRPFGSGWAVAGVADYTGDGTDDIIWQNTGTNPLSTRWTLLYTMKNGEVSKSQFVKRLHTDWTIAAVNDYNGDGKADILLRHDLGFFELWLMNGASRIDTYIGYQPANWELMGAARRDGAPLQGGLSPDGEIGDPPPGSPPEVIDPDQSNPPTDVQVPDSGEPDEDMTIVIDDLTLPGTVEDGGGIDQSIATTGAGGNTFYLPLVIAR